MNVVVRTSSGQPAGLKSFIRGEVRSLEADMAVSNVATLGTIARDSVAEQRYLTMLIAMLATTAVALGAIGIYGVVSYAVSARSRELGLRAALGASPRQLFGIVLGQASRLTALGLVLGLAGAMAVSRLMRQLLYETAPTDFTAYAVTISMIVVVALAATIGPARRAGRADPLTVLRN